MAADVLSADRRFFEALLAADAATLRTLLHPDFLIVDVHAGDVTGREQFISLLASGQVRFVRIDSFPAEAVVRRFGECAVVVGHTTMRVTMPDGTELTTHSRYTHVFVRTGDLDGSWQFASAQGTALQPR